MEPTFSSTLSGQSPARGNLKQRGVQLEPADDEEGSNFTVDQVCRVQTRHYKRRRRNEVARSGDAAAPPSPLVQVEDPSTGASRMSLLEAKTLAETEFQQGVTRARSRAKYTRATLQNRRQSRAQNIPELQTGRSMKSNVMHSASADKDARIAAVVEDHAAATQVEEEAQAEALTENYAHTDRANSKSLKALHAKIRAENLDDESAVRCARKDRRKDDMVRKYWQCPMNAMKGHTLCDHHFLLVQANRARYAAAQQRKKAAAKRHDNFSNFFKNANNGVGLQSGSHCTQFEQVPGLPAEVPEQSLPLKRAGIETPRPAGSDQKLDHTEAPEIDDEIAEDDQADSDPDELLPQMPKNASKCKRWYVAPRKTAADHANYVDLAALKEHSHVRETSPDLILTLPMIPPQPAMNGGGRKAQLFKSLLKSL